MEFKNIIEKFKGAKEKAVKMSAATMEKINNLLDEYKRAIDFLEAFGFKVEKFKVEMRAFPEIQTSISGSIDNIHEDKIKHMIEENEEKKLFVSILNALITAKGFQKLAGLKSFTGVILDITIGIPPKISVDFQEGTGEG